MKVKLSYTAEIDEVLPEVALLLGNLKEVVQQSVESYNSSIANLLDDGFNSRQFNDDVATLRSNLAKIDSRFAEVEQIVEGYEDYRRLQRLTPPSTAQKRAEEPPNGHPGPGQSKEVSGHVDEVEND